MEDALKNLLPHYLTETLGEPRRHYGARVWDINDGLHARLSIEESGGDYTVAAFSADGGCIWEDIFDTAQSVIEFVNANQIGS